MNDTILVTGGAGFIGSAFVLKACGEGRKVVNIDKLTYAGNPMNLAELDGNPDYLFEKGDILDGDLVTGLLGKYRPRAVVHFAAESHVDRSILGPRDFMDTNVMGTFTMLEAARAYWNELGPDGDSFRFVHVSTDEVYGSLGPDDPAFSETTPYAPNSPYSASKAAADHLARAYYHTYGLPTMITNCSNNYGPRQFPEKLIPLMILNALEGKPLPVYGDGKNVRDWLYVDDHVDALLTVMDKGKPGETYNIGGLCERTNIEVVLAICSRMDALRPDSPHAPHENLIQYVTDRPGHDRRYAIDCSKIKNELGWSPAETFETGLVGTIDWYLANSEWVESIRTGEYRTWLEKNYDDRR